MNEKSQIVNLAKIAASLLGSHAADSRLAEDTARAIDRLVEAIDPLVTKYDARVCPIPACPVGSSESWAIRGGRPTTPAEVSGWARALMSWMVEFSTVR